MPTAPVVRTMEPEDAHPLYSEWHAAQGAVLRFAVHLAREGYREQALGIRAAADAIVTAGRGIPRRTADDMSDPESDMTPLLPVDLSVRAER